MKTTDKTLQRKTVRLTPEETKKAVLYYLEEAEFIYTKIDKDNGDETKTDGRIFMGKDTAISFDKDGAATVITHYI